ncbi:MAG: helix-turn-helix transcriptional regulator [Tannerella sp.]|jgi:AraC-like DNA-binding protein|nr:helix-turn-helix transcriptional regulator [Tannerella sp.]
MENIFKIKDLGVCRADQVDAKTAFAYYELNAGEEIRNGSLPLNFIFFVLKGVLNICCNEFENRLFQSDEMIFLLRSSAIRMKAVKKTKLYVMYFDTVLSSCDQQLFRAYLPEAEKLSYDFRPVFIPAPVRVFLDQLLYFQKLKVDCKHFNNLKHREFFILLRQFCSRKDLIAFLSPLICHSMSFRNKVLEKYPKLESGRVTEFANLVGMGRKNFDKRFREEFGTSPARWMQQETAKRLRLFLMKPGVTISDTMDKFHFNSPSHFNRFCRRYFNESPGVMIKEAQAMAKKSGKSKKK